MTDIEGSVVLVTGASRGLGRALALEALNRGASKVYGTARDRDAIKDPRIVPMRLDVTDAASVRSLADRVDDVTILINNAGVAVPALFLSGGQADVRKNFETNFFGTLAVTQAVVPRIIANGGGHVLNIASVLSWFARGAGYGASKAALWSMTNALRLELNGTGVGVTGLYVAYMDTDMTAGVAEPKGDPADIARLALDGLQDGAHEILGDDITRQVRGALSGDLGRLYPELALA